MLKKLYFFLIIFIFVFSVKGFTKNLYNDGEKYLNDGDIERAKTAFYTYYSMNPRSYKAPFALYKYIKLNTNLNNSIKFLELIYQKYPNFQQLDHVLDQLASIYYMLERYKESYYYYKELFNRFTKSNLQGKACYYICKILIINKQYESARSFIKRVHLKLKGDLYYYNLLFLVGESYYFEKQYENAISFHKKISKLYNQSEVVPSTLLQLGYCNWEINKPLNSYQHMKLLLNKYPNSFESDYAKEYINKRFTHKENKVEKEQKSFTINSNGYLIQLGAYSTKTNAEKVKFKVKNLGFVCKIKTSVNHGKMLYKPILGTFKTKNEAVKIAKLISKRGLKAIIIKTH